MQDGNTPGQLAEQQENQKCAQLLQEHQGSSVDTEDDDLPQFLYCKKASLNTLFCYRSDGKLICSVYVTKVIKTKVNNTSLLAWESALFAQYVDTYKDIFASSCCLSSKK